MGIIKRGESWYIKWKDAGGVWRREVCTARTKKEAEVLHAEIIRNVDRQLRGLEPLPVETGMNVWGLCEWWLAARCPKASHRRATSTLRVHVQRSELGRLPLRALTSSAIEKHMDAMAEADYAPRSINQFRVLLGGVISEARTAKPPMWSGENPAHLVPLRPVDKTPRPTLGEAELAELITKVPENWRGFFAAAAYLGLRKGELCGLLKSDYDKVRRTLYVGRSHAASQTKGKRVDTLPVSGVLAPFLDAQLETKGVYLFPAPNGRRWTENAACEDILRVAFRRLGWIDGWLHKCRRCVRGLKGQAKVKARTEIRSDSPDRMKCPKCKFALWPAAIARDFRFHDLRHSFATNLLKSGVSIWYVQRLLRHSSITTTLDTYGHLLTEDLRSAVENLGPRPVHPARLRSVPSHNP
jgi:integrase